MSSIVSWTRNNRLIAFFALTFALSWGPWPAYALGLSPTPFLAGGPLVATLVILGITEGRAGYRLLWAAMIHWRVGWRWWVVALGLPLTVLALGTLANVAFWDAPVPVLPKMAWADLALIFAVRLINPLDGPLGEEPGWRGYALPRLQAERSRLAGGTVLAGLVALWHVPIVVIGMLPPFALVVTFAITFVYQWLFNHTGGSVLMTMLFHIAQGTVSYTALGFAGADSARMDWITGGLWCAIAVAVITADKQVWRAAPASALPAIPARRLHHLQD